MKILVACEESQAVTIELRKLGHEAYSCDIIECSGGHPEWHTQGDALKLISREYADDDGWWFCTTDGKTHHVAKWDMILAFPPCTHLAVSGAKHFEGKRADGRQRDGLEFFCKFLEADCDKVAIENPVNIVSGDYCRKWFPDIAERYGLPIKPTQKIHPWMFGDPYEKTTCLWLKGLPELENTNIVTPEPRHITSGGKSLPGWYNNSRLRMPGNRQKVRSKTFPGIAKAMAEQWAGRADHD